MGEAALNLSINPPVLSERELYAKIYANAQDSVFLLDPQTGKILFTNPRVVEDTSYEMEEFADLEFRSLFLPEDQAAIDTLVQSTLEWKTGIDPQRILKRKSGKKIFVEITSLLVDFEGKKAVAISVRDISARVKAEKKILEYSKELEKINAELEDRVKARTSELADALGKIQLQKKELDDVMNNIQQAILTISPEQKINAEYSKFAEEVFGNKTIAGMDLVEFLYEPGEREQVGVSLKSWLQALFDQPDSWELIKDFAVKELKYVRPSTEGEKQERDLKFEWRPILGETGINKLMLVCIDVTEQKRLEAEIARKETEHKEELELISQLIHLPLDVVEQFISDFERNLKVASENLNHGEASFAGENLKSLKRSLHTIKGGAKQFNLDPIQRRAHELEDRLEAWETGQVDKDQTAEYFKWFRDEYKLLEKGLSDLVSLYQKFMGKGDSKPTGSARKLGGGETFPVPAIKIDSLLEKVFPSPGNVPTRVVRKAVAWLVQAPVATLFDRLQGLAESLSKELSVPIQIVREGDQFGLDYKYSSMLYDAFLHVIRNSMDHGADTQEERQAAGKPAELTLKFVAKPAGKDQLTIQISDDGRGIDPAKVKQKALEKGLVTPEQAARCSEQELIEFVFLPGFSTKETVTDLSGRGVGLDVLKDTVEKNLKGSVDLKSQKGKGTIMSVQIPSSRAGTELDPMYCVPTEAYPKAHWEQLLKQELKEVSGSAPPPQATIFTDVAGLGKIQRTKNTIVMDDLAAPELLEKLLVEKKTQHFVHPKFRNLDRYLKVTAGKTQSFSWGLESYLSPGTPIQTFRLLDYKEKGSVIEKLDEFTGQIKAHPPLPEICRTIADEMIMNGMFDAPRAADGSAKYNHLSRTEDLVLEPNEAIQFRFAADREFIAISVEDPFGALTQEIFAKHALKGYQQGREQISQKPGGAGLGLFMIFDNSHAVIINVEPGKKTEVISLIGLTRTYADYQRCGKSFSYFSLK